MSTTDYLINAALILVVLLQIRERRLGPRTILLPVVIVAFAAQNYLHSIPTSGNDVVLIAVLIAIGATLGAFAGLFMKLRRGDDGATLARAGWLAAGLWVVGIGTRLAFVLASENGAGHTIARFSIDNQISGAAAWTAALVLMAFAEVFARLIVIQLRSLRLARAGSSTSVAVAGA
jgi:hypothetical protein